MASTGVSAAIVADSVGGQLIGDDRPISGIAPLGIATHSELTFATDPVKAAEQLASALAVGAVVLVPADHGVSGPGTGAMIVVDNPRAAFAQAVTSHFVEPVEPGIASTAIIHDSAVIAESAHIGEFTVIGPGVRIGEHAEVRHHVVVGARVQIGAHNLIKSHAVIGEEGFGVDQDAAGNNVRIPHLGSVVLADHVEVGNFTTVCSGTISPTVVGEYTKIDDHVHVAHNVTIGSNAIITACAEISGSVRVGDGVWIGPNASIIDNITVGDRALIGIGAVVTKSVPGNEIQFGNPARRFRDRD